MQSKEKNEVGGTMQLTEVEGGLIMKIRSCFRSQWWFMRFYLRVLSSSSLVNFLYSFSYWLAYRTPQHFFLSVVAFRFTIIFYWCHSNCFFLLTYRNVSFRFLLWLRLVLSNIKVNVHIGGKRRERGKTSNYEIIYDVWCRNVAYLGLDSNVLFLHEPVLDIVCICVFVTTQVMACVRIGSLGSK